MPHLSRTAALLTLVLLGGRFTTACSRPEPAERATADSVATDTVAVEAASPSRARASERATRRPPMPDIAPGTPVETEMRNVDFHVDSTTYLGIRYLRGRLEPVTKGVPPVFDDKTSFNIAIDSSDIVATTLSLQGLLNNYVFNYPDAPLSHLHISTDSGRLKQTGKLKSLANASFEMIAEVSLTPEGEIKLHPVTIKTLGVKVKGLMKTFGIQMDGLVKVREYRGVRVDGNDLYLSAEELLPPPHVRGHLVGVEVGDQQITLHFGAPEHKSARLSPPEAKAPNFMFFHGGVLRFGKLTMTGVDMEVVDADTSNAFDFFLDRYNDQLVAGHERNL
ncbi:MAG: hypothetical protein ABJD11_08040, partial [Gemmatimonadota bacterium]